jgi:hypothetical protein
VTLSADAWVVRSVHESISDADQVWVCAGATADVSGNNGTVYVESGGTVQVNGNGFQVFGDGDADITFYGNNNEGWVMDPDGVTVLGNGNTVEQCDQVQVQSPLGNPC